MGCLDGSSTVDYLVRIGGHTAQMRTHNNVSTGLTGLVFQWVGSELRQPCQSPAMYDFAFFRLPCA